MIDWDRVRELREEVGPDDFAEIAALFLSELEETLDTLAELRDPTALSNGYHGLKGSAMNLGFAKVAELSARAEVEPHTADLPMIKRACENASKAFVEKFPVALPT